MAEAKEFMVEDARIIFRNFAGKESQFNAPGNRNFGCILPADVAEQMLADGWNVKYLEAREEGEEDVPWVSIKVNYQNRPPRITLITSGGRTSLDEESVEVLDWAEYKKVDLICRGFDWDVNGKQGTKAYLKTMFVTIEEDDLERKYNANSQKNLDD